MSSVESEKPRQGPVSRRTRPAPLVFGFDHPAAPPPSPQDLSRKDPPSPPPNPPPTPHQSAVFRDSTRWTTEETGNLALACQSGVPLGWDEVAQLFPGKSPKMCMEKFHEIEQMKAEKDSSVAWSIPGVIPMAENQHELRYWIAPEHCKTPRQKEEDIGAWFAGIDVLDIEYDRQQSYPLA
ncbi:hypothetical protein BDD12DRAFT_829636 [Trichophaea hybrida]|nr:hypothetical protein BDD12DRAFT_829636 [Trichophaea hybrida]